MASAADEGELALLDRVLFRMGMAETDAALEEAVRKFLAPSLLKLASPREGVRKKVMELLVHVNKRIKGNERIRLPMTGLAAQYGDPASSTFVTNFTVIYLRMGFPRMESEERARIIPALLAALEGKPASHQDSLMLLMLPALGEVKPPEGDDSQRAAAFLGLRERPNAKRMLYEFLLNYLLLPYGSHPSIVAPPPAPPMPQLPGMPPAPEEPPPGPRTPAGMCEADWKRVAGETPTKAEELERNKVKVVKFLGSGLMEPMEVALLLVVAAADTRHSVASQSDTEMRRLSGGDNGLDWEDPGLVAALYGLFLGTLSPKGAGQQQPKPELKKVAANTRIRLKLMQYLLKSRQAAVTFPACIQATFDLLFGTGGNSNAKLRMLAVTLIHHIIQNNPPGQRLDSVGPLLLSALTKLVNEDAGSGSDAKMRASCYIAIGKLGLKVPQLVNKDVTVIQTFFDAIVREDKDTQLSVQEAMSMMAPAFRRMDADNLRFMEAMLGTYVEKEEAQVRMVAVQYAGEVFPATHVSSRYILLLGAGDAKEEVAKEARGHLYGAVAKLQQQSEGGPRARRSRGEAAVDRDTVLPPFVEMVGHVLDKASIRAKTQRRHLAGDRVLAFHPSVYVEILNYLRLCLIHSSGADPSARDALSQPEYAAPAVARFLGALDAGQKNRVEGFLELADNLLSASQGEAQSLCMLQLVGVTGYENYGARIGWLKGLLDNTKEAVRETVAHLYGLVVAQMDRAGFERAFVELTRSFREKSLEFQHGIVLALGHGFGRRALLTRMAKEGAEEWWESYRSATQLILGQLDSPNPLLVGAACSALGELGRSGPLPLSDEEEEEAMETDDGGDHKKAAIGSKLELVRKLLSIVKGGKVPMRVREKAALALGKVCVGDQGFRHSRTILEEFLKSANEIKDLELHFTMGEATVYAAMGTRSPVGRDLWRVEEGDFVPIGEAKEHHVAWLLDQVCDNYIKSSHPYVKQASCMWLLAVVKHGQDLPEVKERLLEVQSAFMSLLGDSNDLIQDAASKGLGLVYEGCSEGQQKEMVDALLRTLMEGKRDVQKVSGDTKIFQDGELGKAPSGGNISTYKELCSLATDLNQPDLVYKFMHLANYNATWNSRRGAAFGFSSIAARAGEQLESHLPKIVPKLYRYQFDPTPNIQASMSSIWNALVPETNKAVDKYFAQIIEEIATNLTSNQWRVRESCCNALCDLLRGRNLDDDNAIDFVPALWNDIFRVMDDIKESVRLAAGKAAGSLSRASVKMCDADTAGQRGGGRAVEAVMAPLLENGLASGVADVRAVVIGTVAKITKSAGPLLKPHLAKLIPALLEATSELESKEVNYLSVRLANDGLIQEKLDLARIAAARSSSMMECVTQVLQFVDADTLTGLVPRLVDLIKGNVGIGAKGSTAHLVTTLTHQCPLDLQPHTGKILAAFVSGLVDRNAAVRKTYASAIGHLMRTAKDSSLEKLFSKLRTWYMDRDDEASKWAVAYTFEAVNRHNPDRLKAHAAQALPVAFLAMHEEKRRADSDGGDNEDILEIWEEVWSDGTPGTEGGIRLYLKEIVSILEVAIESQQWRVKAQAARAMGTVAAKLGPGLPQKEQRLLLTILINALAGRTWDGKEAVVRALSDVVVGGGKESIARLLSADEDLTEAALMESVFRECGKEKLQYRLVALEAAGRILRELRMPYFGRLYEITFPLIKKEDEDVDMEDAAEAAAEAADREESEKNLLLRAGVYSCLGDAWASCPAEAQSTYLRGLLGTLRLRAESTTKRNQVCIVECLNKVALGWDVAKAAPEQRSSAFAEMSALLSTVLAVPKSSNLRQQSLKALELTIRMVGELGSADDRGSFRAAVARSVDDVVKDVGGEAASKAKARDLKSAIAKFPVIQVDEKQEDHVDGTAS